MSTTPGCATSTAVAPLVVPAGPTRILVVDDDPDVRQIVASVLQQAGHHVETAEDGEAAWTILLAKACDLLVTDHLMPNLSGVALVRRVRVAKMALLVIMASGTMEDALLPRDPWSRVDALIRKPFTRLELLTLVDRILPGPGRGSAVLDHVRPSSGGTMASPPGSS
jgi:CheY-like chemotaxis protein